MVDNLIDADKLQAAMQVLILADDLIETIEAVCPEVAESHLEVFRGCVDQLREDLLS